MLRLLRVTGKSTRFRFGRKSRGVKQAAGDLVPVVAACCLVLWLAKARVETLAASDDRPAPKPPAAPPAAPPAKPTGYWAFNDPDMKDATVADRSGHGHHGLIVKATLVAGRMGQGIELDGSGTGFTVTDIPAATHQRSVSLWFRKRAGGVRRLIHFDAWNQVGFSNDALFVHTGRVGRADFNLPMAAVPIEPDRWTHLVVTWDATRQRDHVKVYLDGRLTLQATLDASAGRPLKNSTLRIGHDGQEGENAQRFIGVVDEVAVYDTALTEQQVREYVQRIVRSSGGKLPAAVPRRVISQSRSTKPFVINEKYRGPRKLIRVGSELGSRLLDSGSMAAADLPAKVKAWQQTGFDGMVFSIASHQRNKPAGYWNMTGQWWNLTRRDYSEFTAEIAAFRAVSHWGRLTDNFLWSSMAVWQDGGPSRCQDWFRDDDWDILLDNIALQTRVARESGFRGILLDTEQYVGHHARGTWHLPFNYAVYAEESDQRSGEQPLRRFDEVAAQVRRRGQQYGRTVSRVFPGVRLFVIPGLYELVPRDARLEECEYGLYPAFLDGLLSGLDRDAMVIGGNEMTYDKTRQRDLARIRHRYDEAVQQRCSVAATRRPQVTFAAGIWADAGGSWSDVDVEQNARPPREHRLAVRNAFQVSGEYAWLYGEKSFFLRSTPTRLMREYFQANRAAHPLFRQH